MGHLLGKPRSAWGAGSQQGAAARCCLSFPSLGAPLHSPQLSPRRALGEAQDEDVPRRRLPRAAR